LEVEPFLDDSLVAFLGDRPFEVDHSPLVVLLPLVAVRIEVVDHIVVGRIVVVDHTEAVHILALVVDRIEAVVHTEVDHIEAVDRILALVVDRILTLVVDHILTLVVDHILALVVDRIPKCVPLEADHIPLVVLLPLVAVHIPLVVDPLVELPCTLVHHS